MLKLNQAYMEMGKFNFELIKNLSRIRYSPQIDIIFKKKAGILTPKITYNLLQERQLPAYSFERTSHNLDELIIILQKFFQALIIVAQLEDLMLKFSLNFNTLNRRINALEHHIIPNLKFEIHKIKSIIEEIEREEYVRLKITKNSINKKKMG